ncbi:MAG: hypothetical protein EON58_05960 [Alphaproteobacteria bacterium]|nr:MAG: hypothetical protein EON58_05960 [Alphaproteobacteria bacterium]
MEIITIYRELPFPLQAVVLCLGMAGLTLVVMKLFLEVKRAIVTDRAQARGPISGDAQEAVSSHRVVELTPTQQHETVAPAQSPSEPQPVPTALTQLSPRALALRRTLISVARVKGSINYYRAAEAIGLNRGPEFFGYLNEVSFDCKARGEPNLAALVHNQGVSPGDGFFQHLGYRDSRQPGAVEAWQRQVTAVFNFHWYDND